jgi:hypothetical protein
MEVNLSGILLRQFFFFLFLMPPSLALGTVRFTVLKVSEDRDNVLDTVLPSVWSAPGCGIMSADSPE